MRKTKRIWDLVARGWHVVAHIHTAYWLVFDVLRVAAMPVVITGLLTFFWEHSAALLIIVFTVLLTAATLLWLAGLGEREEALQYGVKVIEFRFTWVWGPPPDWEKLRQFWWLWLMVGLAAGLGGAVWILPRGKSGSESVVVSPNLGSPDRSVTAENQKSATDYTSPQPPQKSRFLGLDDAARWRFVKAFQDTARKKNGDIETCSAVVNMERNKPQVAALWEELQQIIYYAGWHNMGGGRSTPMDRTFANGVTILVGTDNGDAFTCGAALTQSLQAVTSIPVSMRKNQTTQDLNDCKNECVEIEIGDSVVR
jgi:hypothetical protein